MVRVALIGLDGADPSWMRVALNQGLLPNLKRRLGGRLYECLSTIPPVSASAWLAVTTGGGPGFTGITDFMKLEPSGYKWGHRPVSSADVPIPYIWETAAKQDLQCLIINIPLTYPVRPFEGTIIAGFPALHDKGLYHPAEKSHQLSDYMIDVGDAFIKDESELDEYCKRIGKAEANRAELAVRLLREKEYDLFAINLVIPDRLGHAAYPELEKLADGKSPNPSIIAVLKEMDQAFALLCDALGDGTDVLVISDHGMSKAATRLFCADRFLIQHGYLTLAKPWETFNLKTWLMALGLNRDSFKWLKRNSNNQTSKNTITTPSRPLPVNWSKSQAFSTPLYGSYFGVFLNHKGWMENGIVDSGKMTNDLMDELINLLINAEIEGENPVKEIKKRDEVFTGGHIQDLPDLVVELSPGYGYDGARGRGEIVIPAESRRSGDHALKGILGFFGPHLCVVESGDFNPKLTDLAPTLLYLSGAAYPKLEGDLLTEIIKPEYLHKHPPVVLDRENDQQSSDSCDSDTQKRISEQLRGMGYLS